MSYPPLQVGLPTDPMENVGGSRYLRLTNDCPPQGVILSLEKPSVVHNDKFAKDEYQCPITHYTPVPIEKTLTESSPGFCTALKAATKGEPYGKVLQIRWTKTQIKGGRQVRDWNIREISEADVKQIFG